MGGIACDGRGAARQVKSRNPWPWIIGAVLAYLAFRLGWHALMELRHPSAETRTLLAYLRLHTGWRPPPWFAAVFWEIVLALIAALGIAAVTATARALRSKGLALPRLGSEASSSGTSLVTRPSSSGQALALPAMARNMIRQARRWLAQSGFWEGPPGAIASRLVLTGTGIITLYLGVIYLGELSAALAGRVPLYQSEYGAGGGRPGDPFTAPPALTALWRLWYLHSPTIIACAWLEGGIIAAGMIVRIAAGMQRGLTAFTLGRTALGWAMLFGTAWWLVAHVFGLFSFAAGAASLVMMACLCFGILMFPVTGIVSVLIGCVWFTGFLLCDYVLLWIFVGLPYANWIYGALSWLAAYASVVTFLKLAFAYALGIEALERKIPNIYGNARIADVNDYLLAGLFGKDATIQAMNKRRLNRR